MKKYTLAFNGRLGRKVQDRELDALAASQVMHLAGTHHLWSR